MTREKIKVGVIGAGYWGPNLIRTLREIDAVYLGCVADTLPGRREFIEKRFPGIKTTPEASAILSDKDIEAVVVASPPETHCELTIAALEAGKHVLVEKPMAIHVSDCERMIEVAERSGRTLAVGHLFLYHPAVKALHEMLERGEFGQLFFLSSTRANLGPPNAKVDVLWDLAPHDISMVLHLVNESPVAITAHGAAFMNSSLIETAYINLRFPSGKIAQINVSWLTPNKTRRLELVCEKRTAVYDEMQPQQKLQIFELGIDNRVNAIDTSSHALSYGPGAMWSPSLERIESLRAECEDFIRCIRSGEAPVSNARKALETVRVLQAASESIWSANATRNHCEIARAGD